MHHDKLDALRNEGMGRCGEMRIAHPRQATQRRSAPWQVVVQGIVSMSIDKNVSWQQLGDEPRQFQLLVQSVVDYAIYMLDTEGVIRSWNAGGHRIKGYSAEEVIGQNFSRFYLPEDVAKGVPSQSLETARTKGKYEAEGWRMRKDGSRFRASVVIDPIYQAGMLVGFAKITRDITERHEAQNKLLDAERELVQAQKAEAIGKLTFGLAHDFNNLLAIVVNTFDMVAMQPEATPRIRHLVDTGLQAAERGALLTRQLLSFAQGQELAPELHEINSLLTRSEELYRRAAGSDVLLDMQLADELPMALVDAAQFEAALLNLVSNSRDATPSGGSIIISTALTSHAHPSEPDSPGREFIDIAVSDTGTGMSEEVIRRSAEPFFTTKEVGKGSGLGLSQVFGFAAQSGGFASIGSQVGKGASVRICLPPVGR